MKKAILRFDTYDGDIGKLAQIHIPSLPDNLFIPAVIEYEPENGDLISDSESCKELQEVARSCKELQEVANHLRDRVEDINHEIMIPQSNEAKCFLDGKRKAFQYVLDLLEKNKNEIR